MLQNLQSRKLSASVFVRKQMGKNRFPLGSMEEPSFEGLGHKQLWGDGQKSACQSPCARIYLCVCASTRVFVRLCFVVSPLLFLTNLQLFILLSFVSSLIIPILFF